jgi:hypothetical protein
MISVSRMCIRVRRGRQRPRERCRQESRQAMPKFPLVIGAGGRLPGSSGCAGRAADYAPPEAVADTEQVEGVALERGGVVRSRKPGRAGSAGAMV